MDVLIDSRTSLKLPEGFEEIIQKVAEETVLAVGVGIDKEVSVSVVDDNEIRELNRRFRNINKETDVLSFPNGDGDSPELGDIIISGQLMYSQAELFGHSPQREMGFLIAHGMLHLLGYDHESQDGEQVMRNLQGQVMRACGLEMG